MEGCATCRVRPYRERCTGHVDRRRSANDTATETQARWQQWIDAPCFCRTVGHSRCHRDHGNTSRHGLILWVVIQNDTRFKDGEIDGMRSRTTCCIRINCEQGQGHVDRWCTRKNTISKVQSCWNRWMDAPCLNASTCDGWMKCGHGNASNQREILWIVVHSNDWLKDGDVDSVCC